MGASDNQIIDLVWKVNGILFPGGNMVLIEDSKELTEYTIKGWLIYEEAKWLNDNGVYFPIWGTCLGFEQLHIYEDPESLTKGFNAAKIFS